MQDFISFLIDKRYDADLNLLLQDHKSKITEDVIISLRKYVNKAVRQTPQEVSSLMQLLRIVASITDLPIAEGYVYWAEGNLFLHSAQYTKALNAFIQANEQFQLLESRIDVMAMQVNQILALRGLGRYKECLELARCVKIDSLPPFTKRELQYLANLEGCISWVYEELGQVDKALEACIKTHDIHLQLDDVGRAAISKSTQAYILGTINRFEEAEQILLEVTKIYKTINYTLSWHKARLNLGLLAYRKGQYQRALHLLMEIRQEYFQLAYDVEVAYIDLERTTIYLDLNLLGETLTLSSHSLRYFRREQMLREQVRVLVNQGIAYRRLGRYEAAAKTLAKARRILYRQGAWGKLWTLDVERAELAWQMGLTDRAWRIGRRVENRMDPQFYSSLAARLHLLLARCCLQRDDRQAAQSRLRQAVWLCKQYHLTEIGIQAYAFGGTLLEAQGDLMGARQQLELAVAESERLLSYLSMDEFQLGFMEGKLNVYATLVRLTHQAMLSVGCQTAVLLHSLNQMQRAPLPYDDVTTFTHHVEESEQLRKLRQRWQWFQHQLGRDWQDKKEKTPKSEVDARAELYRIEQDIAESLRQQRVQQTVIFDETAVSSAIIKNLPPQQLLIALQEQLSETEGLIQFYETNGRFHALLVTKDDIYSIPDLVELPVLQKVMRAWHFYLRQMQAGRTVSASPYVTRLYQMLWAPLATYLTAYDRLYIVLPPNWHDLPLAAFYDGTQYVIEQWRLTYLSTPGVLLTPKTSDMQVTDKQALIVGYDNNGRLPYATKEATLVSKTLSPTWQVEQVVGEAANSDTFREASQTAHLIHLATHAVFRPDNPYFSWIQFAESSLTVADMYQITLPKRPLVVLSACETGKGLSRGGGLLGMGRGFLAAGASSLIVTLWRVHDATTADFIQNFYNSFEHVNDIAHILQVTQIDAISVNLSPFYWAGFIYIDG